MTDPWAILSREQVMTYLTDGYPTTDQIDMFGTSSTGLARFIDGITKSGSTMNIGMFGQDDYYFFYCRFKPTTDYLYDGDTFAVWFQMGDTDSDWEGVSWEATADVTAGDYEPLTGVSASNTDFVDEATDNYGTDTMFWGQINYSDSSNAWVEIIR